jgi:hypothetical protein
LHAVEHLLTGLLPLLVMCDRRDVAGESSADHPDLGTGGVFLYDVFEGGLGLAEATYAQIEHLLALAFDTVRRCACANGCPACIQSGACRRGNERIDKEAAIRILRHLVSSAGDSGVGPAGGRRAASAATHVGRDRAIEELNQATIKFGLMDRATTAAPGEAEPVTSGPPLPAAPVYTVGAWVSHKVYGRGIVIEVDGAGDSAWITVRFSKRSLVQRFAVRSPALHPEAAKARS